MIPPNAPPYMECYVGLRRGKGIEGGGIPMGWLVGEFGRERGMGRGFKRGGEGV